MAEVNARASALAGPPCGWLPDVEKQFLFAMIYYYFAIVTPKRNHRFSMKMSSI
jgi:hypothetical protein